MSTGRDGGIQFLSHDHNADKLRLGKATAHLVETLATESPFELSVALSTASPRARVVFEYRPGAYPAPGIGRVVQAHLRATEERALFVVGAAGGIDVPRGGFAIAYGPVMASRDVRGCYQRMPPALQAVYRRRRRSAGVLPAAGSG